MIYLALLPMVHGPRGLYHAFWEDGLKKKESQPETDKIKQLIGIELPEGDFEILKEEDKELVFRLRGFLKSFLLVCPTLPESLRFVSSYSSKKRGKL